MPRSERVERPIKKSEYLVVFGSSNAQKGWRDLIAVRLNGLADAWDYLTRTPHLEGPLCSPLKGDLAAISREGESFQRWQLKLSSTDGARIWYYVHKNFVILEQIHTNHPNQTK